MSAARPRFFDGLALCCIAAVFHCGVIAGIAHFPFDYDGYHYPLLYYTAKSFAQRSMPLFDPYCYSGMAFYNNPQAGIWYPGNLLYTVGSALLCRHGASIYAAQYLDLFHFFWGALGLYLLLIKSRLSRPTAFAGGCLYLVNGHILAQAQHLGVIQTMAWLPWILWLAETMIQAPSALVAFSLGAALGMPALIGFLPLAMAVYIVFAGFLMARTIARRAWTQRHMLAALAAFAVGALMAAPAIGPLLATWKDAIPLQLYGPNPARMLLTLFSPNYFGTFGPMDKYRGSDITTDYLFAGTLTLVLFVVGTAVSWPRRKGWIAGAVLCGMLAFGPGDLVQSFIHRLPLVGTLVRPAQFAYPMMLFGLIVAAHGIESCRNCRWPLAAAVAIAALGILLTAAFRPLQSLDLRMGLLSVGILAAGFLMSLRRGPPFPRAVLITALLAEPAVINFHGLPWSFPGVPVSNTLRTLDPSARDLLSFVRASPELYRVAVDQQHLGGPWNSYWRVWGIDSINGFDPLMSRSYRDALFSASSWHSDRTFTLALDAPILKLLNVGYLITDREVRDPHWQEVRTTPLHLYRYTELQPRYAVLELSTLRLNAGQRTATYDLSGRTSGSVTVQARRPGFVDLSAVATESGAFLFLGERAVAGWRLQLDGRPVPLWLVNDLMLGIPIAQGSHRLVLKFEPPSFLPSLLLGIAGAVLWIAACLHWAVFRPTPT